MKCNDVATLVQIKCDSDLHLRTSTTNLTMSGLEVKSGITNRVWPINTVESRRTFPSKVKNLHNAVNKNNLVQICITSNRKPVISNKSTLSASKFCLFGLLNCQSVRNKYLSIKDYVVDKDFDIFAITETWLNTGDYDNLVIGSLIPNGYRFLHSARDGRSGGVGLLFKSSLPAFDTVDHSLLLARLSTRFGICDQALDWFRSYLSDRTQYVRIQDVSSDGHALWASFFHLRKLVHCTEVLCCMALIWALCSFCSCSSCAGSPSLVYCMGVLVLHGPNLGGLCCIWWCDLLRWVSFTGVLCGGPRVSSVCLVLCLCGS